ncbi:hypothetical protein CRE_16110 [Caenorhabditis remanei]|uniref:Uncharacterized protein n=1 Tax=Caenorhabditis remanei TaxID=31234 RepID=E3MBW4_CAERE|nr:hypothetical protein CRE_16110 [Caenorhabditis remanei]
MPHSQSWPIFTENDQSLQPFDRYCIKRVLLSVDRYGDNSIKKERKLNREPKEIKEIKESNDRINASMKNNIEVNQRNHDEQIAKIIEEHDKELEQVKQFLHITEAVYDASESLRHIERYCSNESPENFEGEIAVYLDLLKESKKKFTERVYHFQEFVIYEQNAHQEILNVCKSYLEKFEKLMMKKSLLELCFGLPTAIENKEMVEIEEFKKKAEKLYPVFSLIYTNNIHQTCM